MPRRILTLSQLVAAALRRPAPHKHKKLRRPKTYAWLAKGGPYDGQVLALHDGTTAPLRVGDQRGRYRVGVVARCKHLYKPVWYRKPWNVKNIECDFNLGTTVWKPSP